MVILASQSISVEQTIENGHCPGVQTLDFSQEGHRDFRNARYTPLEPRDPLFWYWTTEESGKPPIDSYQSPSEYLQRIANTTAVQQKVLQPQVSSNETCGKNWDCRYTLRFTGPGYRCEDLSEGAGPPRAFHGLSSPVDPMTLFPNGNYSYHSIANQGEYPRYPNPSEPGFGAFRTEPIIWAGYSLWTGPEEIREESLGLDPQPEYYTPHFFACELWETEYQVEFQNYQGVQSTTVQARNYTKLLINTTLTNDGTPDNATAVPIDRYVFPLPDRYAYQYTAAFHSIGKVFRDLVNGFRPLNETVKPFTYTEARYTKLFPNRDVLFPVPDLMDATRSLFEDLLLSVLSDNKLLPVVPAVGQFSPQISVSEQPTNGTHGYPCVRTQIPNRFQYSSIKLWLVYGVSLGLAAASVIVGTCSVIQNGGVLQNTRFTSIAVLLQHCGYGYDSLKELGAGGGLSAPR